MSKTIKLGVIGHPISHSKSPLIHNHWIRKYGLDGSYEAIDIAPEDFTDQLRALVGKGYSGFNLTVPHKELAFDLCDEVDELAHAVGAVNTIYLEGDRLCGTNTDVFGFVQNIKDEAPAFNFKEGPAVVLGAGGAAKAVIYGLLQEGAPEIRLLNRTRSRAEELAALSPKIKVLDWINRAGALSGANLLVNTTALGMAGQPPLEIDLSILPKEALVNDIVYAPLYTDLLEAAHARGNKAVTGIGMLLQQARPAFEKWFGVLPDLDEELLQDIL